MQALWWEKGDIVGTYIRKIFPFHTASKGTLSDHSFKNHNTKFRKHQSKARENTGQCPGDVPENTTAVKKPRQSKTSMTEALTA